MDKNEGLYLMSGGTANPIATITTTVQVTWDVIPDIEI